MINFSELGKVGRLGNQMFQISACVGYAKKHKMNFILPYFKYENLFKGPFHYAEFPPFPKFNESGFKYQEIPYMEDIDLYGYFQSEKYFEHCKDEIKNMFTFNSEIINLAKTFIETSSNGRHTVAIHVRRTDYVEGMAHYYHELTLDWYKKAINKFHGDFQFIVMSDDIQWCKQNMTFLAPNISFCGFTEEVDLCIMSLCNHNIICNSSFSWWGSYLNNNPDKMVIAPSKDKWFKPVAGHNIDDLYLLNWELL